MRPATVALACGLALDVAAARRLHDYGDLDDAGVERALEQMQMQRYGTVSRPAYLYRIDRLAAVVEQGEEVRLVMVEGRDDETELFDVLARDWPRRESRIVDWDGTTVALLSARACLHDRVVPAGLYDDARVALAEHFDPNGDAHDSGAAMVERDLAVLLGDAHSLADDDPHDVCTTAARRYRWWLRWQCSQRLLSADERRRREATLNAIGVTAQRRA